MAIARLCRVGCSHNTRFATKCNLYKCLIVLILLYGLEMWTYWYGEHSRANFWEWSSRNHTENKKKLMTLHEACLPHSWDTRNPYLQQSSTVSWFGLVIWPGVTLRFFFRDFAPNLGFTSLSSQSCWTAAVHRLYWWNQSDGSSHLKWSASDLVGSKRQMTFPRCSHILVGSSRSFCSLPLSDWNCCGLVI